MLDTHEKFKLMDKGLKNDFFAEVNYEPDNPAVNECKVFKFTFPNGEVAYVERKLLHEMIFACGTGDEQQKMIPQTIMEVRWYETILSVKATKDINKGESITFPVKLSLPKIQREAIGDLAQPKSPIIF